jgi:hypothetical protein
MPRGDGTGPRGAGAGTGRGLGGCPVRGTGASKDPGAGLLQRIMDSGSGSDGRLTDRGQGNSMTVLDALFSLFERVTRK